MIISHRLKFAFFANQKTGSKAAGIMLRLSGVFNEHDILINQPFLATRTVDIRLPGYNLGDKNWSQVNHMTPEQAINAGFITLEQLREYNCFAFLREPEERFHATRISMMRNRYGQAEYKKRMGGVPPAQYDFFHVDDEQVVTPLDFRKYDDELRRLYYLLDAPYRHLDFPVVEKLKPVDTPIIFDPRHHQKDIVFYRRSFHEDSNT